MGIREDVVLVAIRVAAEFPADIGLIACTTQVRFSQAEDADQAVGVRVTGTDDGQADRCSVTSISTMTSLGLRWLEAEADVDVFKIARVVNTLDTAAGSVLDEYRPSSCAVHA